jgi:hypothetical protein
MIVDHRTYTIRPGQVAAWVALYKEFAWPLQQKYLQRCLGFYTSADGKLNTVIHLWAYDSMADRETRRAAMTADPGWKLYMEKSAALGALVAQETAILTPTDFSPA